MHKNYFFNQQDCSTNLSKISLIFTDKRPFWTILSVISIFGTVRLWTRAIFIGVSVTDSDFAKGSDC
ncbi:hypothetical protein [Ligilactobacillus ruminis]|uniref:hypothetical protein n=1 Tax=Ligilactobacillus ruminis TaxID=1623 RepID=UPI00232F74A2|nr:hypothetical protein [Ligilactobacillus ruminis]